MQNDIFHSDIPSASNFSKQNLANNVSLQGEPQNLGKESNQDSKVKAKKVRPKLIRILTEVTIKYLVILSLLIISAVVAFFIAFRPAPTVSVPNLVGKSYIDSVLLLQERQLFHEVKQQYTSDPSDVGRVIQQSPSPGMPVRTKKIVTLTVSQGTVVSAIPDFLGFNLDNVQQVLKDQFSGFQNLLKVRTISKILDEQDAGVVIGQYPKPGTKINNVGTELDIVVSRGLQEGKVFDMLGLEYSDVYSFIQEANIPFEFYFSEFSEPLITEINEYLLKAGIIQEQAPAAGSVLDDTTILRLGIRRYYDIQDTVDKPEEDVQLISLPDIKILKIPIPRQVSGVVRIIHSSNGVNQEILSISQYPEAITLPIKMIEDDSYSVVSSNDNVFWSYTVSSSKKSKN